MSNFRIEGPPPETRRGQARASAGNPSHTLFAQASVEQSDDWIAWIDAEALLRFANPALCRALGYSTHELLALHAWDIYPTSPESWPLTWAEMKRHISRTFILELRSRAGGVVVAETRVKFVTVDNRDYLLCCGRERAAEPEPVAETPEQFSVLLESLGDAIFVLDQGRVVDSNLKARELFGDLGAMLTEYPPLRELMARALSGEEVTFRRQGRLPSGPRFHIECTLCRIQVEGHIRVLAIAVDVTAKRKAAHWLSQLSGRLLQTQDEERRRIARELHDATGQNLGALSINLSMILANSSGLDRVTRQRLEQCLALAGSSVRETRTMSYLLHPPLLDEMGLDAALRGYIDGYSERTGIRVDLDLPSRVSRLPQEIEVALFRIVQEGIANIHRHSGSRKATLRLMHHANRVELELADFGRGLPPGTLEGDIASASRIGVGIAGMRERARQLGGRLTIASSQAGTTLHVVLPEWHAKRPDHPLPIRRA